MMSSDGLPFSDVAVDCSLPRLGVPHVLAIIGNSIGPAGGLATIATLASLSSGLGSCEVAMGPNDDLFLMGEPSDFFVLHSIPEPGQALALGVFLNASLLKPRR
jgi:hypothetical protein